MMIGIPSVDVNWKAEYPHSHPPLNMEKTCPLTYLGLVSKFPWNRVSTLELVAK